jgi:UDP-2,3-diacylglucosamine hydrolase
MAKISPVYIASDLHLGVDTVLPSTARERLFVKWLDQVAQDAGAIYLLGDIFDFYFEYRCVVPKKHIRLMGKLAELRDAGIPIHFFTGNHDMWIFGYFQQELGIQMYRKPVIHHFGDHKVFLGHGDGLGPGDYKYKFIKKVFAHPLSQWLFERIHPNFGIGMAQFFSQRSRAKTPDAERCFLGRDKEWLVQYSMEQATLHPDIPYFIFGHRHLPIDLVLNDSGQRYINSGDWLTHFSYLVWDGQDFSHAFFERDGRVFTG